MGGEIIVDLQEAQRDKPVEPCVSNLLHHLREAPLPHLRDQLAAVLDELRRLEDGNNVSGELLDTINMIAAIMDGMKED